MSKFTKIPPLRIGRKGQWLLDEHLAYTSSYLEKHYLDPFVIVPEGFETDLASIPRLLTPIVPKNGKHRPAAIIHDYLCRKENFSRKHADKVFKEAMKVLGVRTTRRYAMYYAVRIGALAAKRSKKK